MGYPMNRVYAYRVGYGISVVALGAAIYAETLVEVFREWWVSPEESQGLAIVPIAIVVTWLRRHSIAATPSCRTPRGLLLLGVGCMLHLFGKLAAGVYASGLSFVLVLAGIIWTLWGFDRLRSLTLPMLLLIAALPVPSLAAVSLSMPLQLLASRVACWIADQGGIAVYREGNIIHLAGISVGVWEACSGLNSLSALMAGAILLGFLLCRLSLTRMLLCIAVLPISVTANIVRVAGTAILSDWHPVYAMGFYHAFTGWFVFLVGTTGLYGAAIGLRRLFDR
jgi:exosortase